ncbi:hypothetical protein VIGAN_01272000 [Vigna angularis var. angularis]|uniref:Uncharacterized protein n=1 Tax=Vigna angularis var. angularis TaxID=157739 RepID=A0A0S3R2Z6_PHAAN|nr:hypothetical protein VIGAN_01272000 [Vigna angularis var. angularis]
MRINYIDNQAETSSDKVIKKMIFFLVILKVVDFSYILNGFIEEQQRKPMCIVEVYGIRSAYQQMHCGKRREATQKRVWEGKEKENNKSPFCMI